MAEEPYANIREVLGDLIGRPLLDITQHDEEYFQQTGRVFVDLMFNEGNVLRFYVEDQGFVLNPTDEGELERFGG